jgi:valyl-tRNA synthetase
MTLKQLDKTYEPHAVEDRWYRYWIDRGFFHASADHPGEPYTIVIPPPNVTGSLHVGHALNNSLQDILIRWRRMQGRNTLWVPGTDHAGIATQNVVERQLMAEGSSREALGRDAFIERVWQWKAQSGETILQQLKRLGSSCDWSRLRFTMDEGLSLAVKEVFVRLYEEGLIYRGERLINWCPRCLTALSDIEVEHEDMAGKLYHIKYYVDSQVDQPTFLTVATTRPETLFGDTAVAVHPEDPRYNHLIGQRVRVPLTSRTIPIVGDAILVDREFGTGAVKITPAHDFNDFEAGERHTLPRISILDQHARLDAEGLQKAQALPEISPSLVGIPVAKARPKVVELLETHEALVKTEDHKLALGRCYRCKTVVEPFLSPQWFVKIQPLATPAIEAVERGDIRFIPEAWTNNYLGWMREIKDWCISRQIWWGHQIPAWYCRHCHADSIIETTTPETLQPNASGTTSTKRTTIHSRAQPVVAREAPVRCATCNGTDFLRDPDVLDTWFSSALWPFSTLGWPEKTVDLKTFYPTSTLVTGLDILFFWVARMIMMGLKFTGQVPFREVYIHALVRDADGKKMSKSKGNVIDPLHVMEQYGTDALRFTLASMASPGRDIKLAEERIEGYRNFANKIWNAARFVLMNLDGPRTTVPIAQRSFADQWIMSRLNHTITLVNEALEQYRFDLAANHLYHFIWHEYCDWYLELIKPSLRNPESPEAAVTRGTLLESFETLMRVLHPLMPFISEEIWQTLPHEGECLALCAYPTASSTWHASTIEAQGNLLQQVVGSIRTARALLSVMPNKQVTVYCTAADEAKILTLSLTAPDCAALSRATVSCQPHSQWPQTRLLQMVVEDMTIGIVVDGDVDLQKALDRITKQQADGKKECSRVEGKLGSTDFTSKAPPEVVVEHEQRVVALRVEQTLLASSAQQLQAMIQTP